VRSLAVVALLVSVAQAYSTGIWGYSGMQGDHCSECHSGSGTATVMLTGPSTLFAGQTANYTVDVVTGATTRVAGFDVAVSGGTLANVTQANPSFLNDGEISHKNPSKGSTVQWQVAFTAPSSAGTVTMFAGGLSADGDGTTNGDDNGNATLQIDVTAAPDLAGVDLGGFDLAVVDMVSAATPMQPAPTTVDMGPPKDEKRWACACQVGGTGDLGSGAGVLLLLAGVIIGRMRRR
jgi:MYXO-CTERM domain-containing protein